MFLIKEMAVVSPAVGIGFYEISRFGTVFALSFTDIIPEWDITLTRAFRKS
ncbi:MAG: hypothetical protein V7750_00985 [Sneathiella sp.]